jgi:cobalt-zinc-cadmium efflux system membrane fusion protein
LDESTRSIEVRFVAANEDRRLKPGMFAQVDIEIPETESRLAIPTSAILTDEGKTFVFCRLKDDLWIRRAIAAGADADGYSPILDGLKEKDVVVIEGGLMLKSDILREKMGAGCAH